MDAQILDSIRSFCIRVLTKESTPQEVAIVPQLLMFLRGDKEKTASGD